MAPKKTDTPEQPLTLSSPTPAKVGRRLKAEKAAEKFQKLKLELLTVNPALKPSDPLTGNPDEDIAKARAWKAFEAYNAALEDFVSREEDEPEDEELDQTDEDLSAPDSSSRWFPLRRAITSALREAGFEPPQELVQRIIRDARSFRP